MNEAEDRKYDTRQLEKMRAPRDTPGEPRLFHLSVPHGPYVVSRWHIRVGDTIRAPQVIATFETGLFTFDFEVFDSGILTEQCFAVGEVIPDGAVVARISLVTETSTS